MSLTDGAIKVLVNAEKAIDDAMRTLVSELVDGDCDARTAAAVQRIARVECQRLHRLELAAIDRQDQIAERKQSVREAIDIFTDGRF